MLDYPNFNPELINSNTNCITPSVTLKNDTIESTALLFFSLYGSDQRYLDVYLIHEINHAIELSFLGQNQKGTFSYKSGFDIQDETITGEKDSKRNYELISEAFNQKIAIEITEAMHNDEIYVLDNPITSKIPRLGYIRNIF